MRLHGERQARKSAQNKRAQVEKLREEARREEARLLEEAARLDLLAAQPAARRR